MPRTSRPTKTSVNPISVIEEQDDGAFYQPGPGRHRHRRDLCLYGARRCHDLPGDRPSEFRPGRNGDVLDLHFLADDAVGDTLLGRLRADAGAFLRRRYPDRTPAVQAAGEGPYPDQC